MKILATAVLALLLAGPGLAQPGTAEVSGEVSRATADSIAVSWRSSALEGREQTVKVALDKRGNFRLRVPLAAPSAASLVYGDDEMPLFLEPDDALQLKFRGDALATTLKFQSADGAAHKPAAAANNYLAAFNAAFAENEGYQVLPENIGLYEKPFLSFLDYRRSHELDLLKDQGRNPFTPAFAAFARAEIDYTYANDRLTYAALREQVVASENRLRLSTDYYDFLRDPAVLPGAAEAASSPQYREFLLNYVHYQVQANGLAPTAPGYHPACYQLARQQLRGPVQLAVLSQLLTETFRFGHLDHARALLADYALLAPPAAVAPLRQDLAAHQALAIGAPAPPLPLRAPGGDSLHLADYRGKLVYVMFWDSRLPLAQRELPFLKDIVARYAGQPVVFICAAFDDDSAAWQRLVTAQPALQGSPQAWVPAAARSAVRANYAIQQLPAFRLLDEQGHILDPNPKRLSSRALQDDLKADQGRAAAYHAVPLPKPRP